LENPGLYEAALTFGFGRPTGIRLPGELAGIVRPLPEWTSYSTGSVPMGQELAVTPLQLIAAHASLANGGRLITPRIVREISHWSPTAPAHSTSPAPVVSRTVSREVADWIVQGPLRAVVQRGTGRRAQSARYPVFGKTGTAQKTDPATGAYSERDHVCSFLCGGPADAPRALVLVTVDSPRGPPPHYGGTVAAPAAARMLEQTLLHLGVPGGTLAERIAPEPR
jgi:cell division protein FtsI/penicillin-binding protein 2